MDTAFSNRPSLSAEDVLQLERMTDDMLRLKLKDRGLVVADDVGRWQLLELYNAFVQPKPRHAPTQRMVQILERIGTQGSRYDIKLFPETILQNASDSSTETVNNLNVISEIAQVSATGATSRKRKRSPSPGKEEGEPLNRKRKIVPITFP